MDVLFGQNIFTGKGRILFLDKYAVSYNLCIQTACHGGKNNRSAMKFLKQAG
jgi:hypothetical protein